MELPEPQILTVGDMELDMERGRLSKGKRSSSVGAKRAVIFKLFSQYPNRMIAEERLRLVLYGDDYRGEGALRAHIYLCRCALRRLQSKSKIVNARCFGWEFIPPA